MSNKDDLTTVLRLAFLTEDRSDAEQRALLRVADRVDFEHNKLTVDSEKAMARPDWQPSYLYDEAQNTRALIDKQEWVELPNRRGVWPRKGR